MATPPDFSSGAVLTAAQMNSVGMWLVKTQTVGIGVASVTVTGAFSADYDNYRIIYTDGVQSVNDRMNIRFGSSTTGYYAGFNGAFYATGLSNAGGVNNGAQMIIGGGDGNASAVNAEIMLPFKAKYTTTTFSAIFVDTAIVGAGRHAVATSFSAFTLLPGAGTMTGGTIRVYGYRN